MSARAILIAVLAVCITATGAAQSGAGCSITSPFDSNNGQSGNMFDVVALTSNGITITGLDINVGGGSWDVEIYVVTGGGSHVGVELTPAAWTLVATELGVQGQGDNLPTPLSVPLSITLPPVAGSVQGIYVTLTNGTAINYTNGTGVGNVRADDGVLQILEGVGNPYPFGGFFTPRVWNGNIYYTEPTIPLNQFQTNTPGCSMTVDGELGSQCAPAQVSKTFISCNPVTPAEGVFNLSSNSAGSIFDAVVSPIPTVSAAGGGGILLPDGQIVNVNLFSPMGFTWLSSGGTAPQTSFLPGSGSPFGSTTVSLQVPYLVTAATFVSLQAVVIDGTGILGFSLSQPTEFSAQAAPAQVQVPIANDDAVTQLDVTTACGGIAPGGVNFYGTNYTTIAIGANGRVAFGAGAGGSTDFAPSPVTAIAETFQSVGVWTDWTPPATNTLVVTSPAANVINVDYAGSTFFTEAVGGAFQIEFDTNTGVDTVSILNLQSVAVNPQTGALDAGDNIWIGMSPGAGAGATDPGAVTFSGPGVAALATDSLYDFYDNTTLTPATTATQIAGTDTIVFTPDGFGNYSWLGT